MVGPAIITARVCGSWRSSSSSSFSGRPEHQQRQRRDDDHPAEPGVSVQALAGETAQHGAGDGDELAAEVEHHRRQRAQVHGHVEGQVLQLEAEQQRGQDQVRRAGDRQEFGQALDAGEQGDL
jgi:hypothetical protein